MGMMSLTNEGSRFGVGDPLSAVGVELEHESVDSEATVVTTDQEGMKTRIGSTS